MAADSVGAVESGGVPHVDFPHGLIAEGHPVEGGSGIGHVGNGEAVGRQAGQAVGHESLQDPVAVADAVSRAVLTHTHCVARGGLQAVEGVAGANHRDIGVGEVGSNALFDVHLVSIGIARPSGGRILVGVRDAGDSRSPTESTSGGHLDIVDTAGVVRSSVDPLECNILSGVRDVLKRDCVIDTCSSRLGSVATVI